MLRVLPLRLMALLVLAGLVAGCQFMAAGKAPARPTRPVFYPFPPDPPRVQYLRAFNASWDVVPPRMGLARLVFGERDEASEGDILKKPYGIAVWQGKVYVCDQRGSDVKVFDLAHKSFHRLSGVKRIIAAPTNICVDPYGYKFVVESMRGLIQVFDPNDEYLTTFLVKGARPGGIAVVGDEVFVTDVTGDRILVLDRSSGKVRRSFGKKGHGPGEFVMPNAIAADAEGNLYVSDQMNFRLQKLDRSGKPLLVAGGPGDSYGHFARPRGIAVGPDGVIYAVESVFEVVQMFSQKGRVLMAFGNFHGAPGFLELPASVAVDKSCLPYLRKYLDPRFEPDYLVFVTSQVGNALVGVYAFGHLKPGAAVPTVPVPKGRKKPSGQAPVPGAKPDGVAGQREPPS